MLSLQTAEQTKAVVVRGGIKGGEVVRPMVAASANCGQDPQWHYTQCGSAVLVMFTASHFRPSSFNVACRFRNLDILSLVMGVVHEGPIWPTDYNRPSGLTLVVAFWGIAQWLKLAVSLINVFFSNATWWAPESESLTDLSYKCIYCAKHFSCKICCIILCRRMCQTNI